jgi:hypothetical protein
MTTLILLTPYPGGLNYDFDQNSNYPSKNDKVLMSTAGLAKFVWKNLDSTKARPACCEHFALKWVQQWGKKRAGNQGCNNHASKT